MTLPSDQLPPDLRSLPERIARLERELRELRAARSLAHAAIDGGVLSITDATGAVRGTLGVQPDSTVALVMTAGPTPPTPTPPGVGAGLGTLSVTWDGGGASTLPADWRGCEVHVGASPDFTPGQSTLRATITAPGGGSVLLALPYSLWWVRLRAVSTSGAVSAPSAAVSATPRQVSSSDIAPAVQAPAYRSGWAGGSAAAPRYLAMQLSKDPLNVTVEGTFHATGALAAGSYTVADIPTGYAPRFLQPGMALHESSTDAPKATARIAVDSLGGAGYAGSIVIATPAAIASGDGFYFQPFVIPLSNIA